MAKVSSFNATVLVWALSDAGMSPSDLASATKLPLSRISEFLTKAALPKTTELRAIARALHRPAEFFLLSQPPTRPPVAAAFRGPVGRQTSGLLARENVALRRANRMQRIARWAAEAVGDAPVALPEARKSAEVAAQNAASWLQWTVDEQTSMKSSNEVFRALRLRLEDRGLVVLSLPMSTEACRGFSLPDVAQPLIAVNSAFNPAARTFSLLHELAHLMRGDAAVCDTGRDDAVERWCEDFAANVLLPKADLEKYVDAEFGSGAVLATVPQVSKTAGHFNVSLRAVAVRLEQLKLGAAGLYVLVDKEVEYGGFGRSKESPTRPVVRLRELGTTVPRRLLAARDEGALQDIQVCEYLRLSRLELDDISGKLESMPSSVLT